MKKIILLLAFATSVGVSLADSYLYWMVNNDASGTARGGDPLAAGKYYAKVSAFQTGTSWTDQSVGQQYLNIYSFVNGGLGEDLGNETGVEVQIGGSPTPDNRHFFANIASYGSEYTYFVELWNEGSVVARSEGLPYEQASIAALADISTPGTLWAPMTFVAAPEPNSALLLLIGCATLALRRRKQIVA